MKKIKLKELRDKIESYQTRREANELYKLRKKRIKLEGKATRKKLKEQELSKIKKAENTLGKGKKSRSFFDGVGNGLEMDFFGEKKGKKKKEEWTI